MGLVSPVRVQVWMEVRSTLNFWCLFAKVCLARSQISAAFVVWRRVVGAARRLQGFDRINGAHFYLCKSFELACQPTFDDGGRRAIDAFHAVCDDDEDVFRRESAGSVFQIGVIMDASVDKIRVIALRAICGCR